MGTFSSYLVSVCSGVLLVVLLGSWITKEGMKKVFQLVSGLFLAVLIVSPVLRLDPDTISAELRSSALMDHSAVDQDLLNDQMSDIIKARCREYILDKAEQLGMVINVDVELAIRETFSVPVQVTIQGDYTLQQKEQLEHLIAADLGVSVDCQKWIKN